jgi:hypothetical protein
MIERAYAVGLQHCADRPLRRHRVAADEPPVRRGHAAEVLGPRPVHGAVNHHAADPLRPELLGGRRKGQEGVDLSFGEEPNRVGRRMCHPVDVFSWVQAHVRHHAGEEHVLAGSQFLQGNGLAPEVANRTDALRPEQLEAARVDPREKDDRSPASTRMMKGATKFSVMSTSREASALAVPIPAVDSTYCTSVNPSALNKSSATY